MNVHAEIGLVKLRNKLDLNCLVRLRLITRSVVAVNKEYENRGNPTFKMTILAFYLTYSPGIELQ